MATSNPSANASHGREESLATPASDQLESIVQEAFPQLDETASPKSRRPSSAGNTEASRSRGQSATSSLQGRLRSASKKFEESSPPTGFLVATGQAASSLPSINDIRTGGFNSDGWSGEGQIIEKERRASVANGATAPNGDAPGRQRLESNPIKRFPSSGSELQPALIAEHDHEDDDHQASHMNQLGENGATAIYENGYQFPPKHGWATSTRIGLLGFWNFFKTPLGFFVVIYGLNVVAWGGMLFLLLCNASPAMCHPSCNDVDSGRRVWIEIDSQIVNALFCVTGFGLIPWRFRDLYYLLQYRIMKNEIGLRRLAGINRGWFRLAGSQELPVLLGPTNVDEEATNVREGCIPYPSSKISDAPLTGIRAPPTPVWKLDLAIWAMVWNTFLQVVLSAFMWAYNRINRPSWTVGLFVALACIVAAIGGLVGFFEGKKVKGIEGVPVAAMDLEILKRDQERGIIHFNNINDAPPKEKKAHKHHGPSKSSRNAEGEADVS